MSEESVPPNSRKDSPADHELQQSTLLFVDDESNILSSLRRLFKPLGYKILIAESGKEGLEILETNSVDLIVSDMRMPEMSGAEFLAKAAKKWPDIIRILLTGYADITSTISAINEGKIYQYISKPWEDNDIKLNVQYALKQKALEKQRDQLLLLTKKQNDELQDLNVNLENKVKARTEELNQAMGMLESSHKELKKSYISSIKVFSNITEMRETKAAGHSRRVAEHARTMAIEVEMNSDDVQQVVFAALLHNIGKVGLPDAVTNTPLDSLSEEDREKINKHPLVGEGILITLNYLKDAAKMIRAQNERFDGLGFPDKLVGSDIPIGARIIGLAADFDSLQTGTFNADCLSVDEAREHISSESGKRYDPDLVELFLEITSTDIKESEERGFCVKTLGLKDGMILTQDLSLKTGVLLLTKGYLLDDKLIRRIQKLEKSMNENFEIYVTVPR